MRIRTVISVLAVVAALMVAAPAQAQGTMTVGVTGGFSSSNATLKGGGVSITGDRLAGFTGGISLDRDFSARAGVRIEGLFTQKGFKGTDTVDTFKVRLNYIEIPVLGQAKVKAGEKMTLRVFGGPAFAFKASDRQELNGTKVDAANEEDIKSYDVGIAFGAGVQGSVAGVEFRYTHGLVNGLNNAATGESAKNRALGVLVNINLSKKK